MAFRSYGVYLVRPMPGRWVGLLLMLYGSSVILGASCERQSRAPATMAEAGAVNLPDQESWDVRFRVSEAGRPRAEMIAAYMASYEREDSTYMVLRGLDSMRTRVKVHLFNPSGDSSATLFANVVRYYEKERRFDARGNVDVSTRDGMRLESEHLVWHEFDRKVTTTGFARITTESEQIQGYGLVADEDLNNWSLSRVTGTFPLEDEG